MNRSIVRGAAAALLAATIALAGLAPAAQAVSTGPSQPSNVVVTAVSYNSVLLSWDAIIPGDEPLDRYVIQVDGITVDTTNNTTSLLTGLSTGASHLIYVKAIDTRGYGSRAEVTTPAMPIPAFDLVSPADGVVGTPYSGYFGGGIQNFTPEDVVENVATGMPEGLTVDENGLISGVPTTAGTYDVTITFTLDGPYTISDTVTFVIADAAAVVIADAAAPAVTTPAPVILAATGTDPVAPLAGGVALVLLGAGVLVIRRRRTV